MKTWKPHKHKMKGSVKSMLRMYELKSVICDTSMYFGSFSKAASILSNLIYFVIDVCFVMAQIGKMIFFCDFKEHAVMTKVKLTNTDSGLTLRLVPIPVFMCFKVFSLKKIWKLFFFAELFLFDSGSDHKLHHAKITPFDPHALHPFSHLLPYRKYGFLDPNAIPSRNVK